MYNNSDIPNVIDKGVYIIQLRTVSYKYLPTSSYLILPEQLAPCLIMPSILALVVMKLTLVRDWHLFLFLSPNITQHQHEILKYGHWCIYKKI